MILDIGKQIKCFKEKSDEIKSVSVCSEPLFLSFNEDVDWCVLGW